MADQNPLLLGTSISTPLFNHLMQEARKLPILGYAQAQEIRYLFHFSDDNAIQQFTAKPLEYCWADVISAQVEMVRTITSSLRPKAYTAIYILRIGLAPGKELFESDMVGDWVRGKACREYGISQSVPAGDFARVAIHLDPTGTHYLP